MKSQEILLSISLTEKIKNQAFSKPLKIFFHANNHFNFPFSFFQESE